MATKRVHGKIIIAGYDWVVRLHFNDVSIDFPAEATFAAHVRKNPDDSLLLASLTTANGRIQRIDGQNIDLILPGEESAGWPAGRKVYIDVVRTDEDPAVHLGFRLIVPVYSPVTRL